MNRERKSGSINFSSCFLLFRHIERTFFYGSLKVNNNFIFFNHVKWSGERERALNKWIVKMTRYTWQLNGDFFPIRVCVSLFFRYISFHFEPYHFHKINLVFHLIFLSSKQKCYSLFRFLFKKETEQKENNHHTMSSSHAYGIAAVYCLYIILWSNVERVDARNYLMNNWFE